MDTGDHLTTLGFDHVVVAHRLVKAEALAKERDFDLALLDINVDGKQTSIELGRYLKGKGTTVIFASGNSQAAPGLRKDGFFFMDKPFSLDGMTAFLRGVLEDIRAAS